MAPELMRHQVEGIEFLDSHPNAALYDEPGLGKSVQMLKSAIEPIIVVAPAMVLDSGTWDDEIEKWAPGADVTQVAYTSLAQRGPRGRVPRDANGFPLCPPKDQYRRGWGTKIGDESHYLKGRKTNWTKAFQDLQAECTRVATGTPIPNWAHEAFTQLQCMWPERAVRNGELGSYWRWAREWFMVGPTVWSPMDVQYDKATAHVGPKPGVTWEEFNQANWGNRMILRLRKDCLDLPPLAEQPWKVKMGAAQARAYKELKRDFVTWLDGGTEVAAWSDAGKVTLLQKLASGLEIVDRDARGSAKLDALRTLLADRPRPTLVVAHFRDSVEACARAAAEVVPRANVAFLHGGSKRSERRQFIRAFQRGDLQVLCASIDLISEGMTLHQGGADQVIRFERSWLPSRNEQVARRLHRLGVKSPILLIDLITEDTLDEKVLALLAAKTDHQMRALGVTDLRRLV